MLRAKGGADAPSPSPTVARAAQVALSICMLHVVVTVVQRLSYIVCRLPRVASTRCNTVACPQLLEQLLVAH
jgi:hypothetical protein